MSDDDLLALIEAGVQNGRIAPSLATYIAAELRDHHPTLPAVVHTYHHHTGTSRSLLVIEAESFSLIEDGVMLMG